MERIRWGIIGVASIARRQAIPAIQASQSGVLNAIASRSYDRALEVADEFQIPKAYGSYDELIHADDIDAIYIPLPNDLHLPWIEKAARAGKDVLCEKPLCLDAAEVRRVQEISTETGRRIVEGVSSHFHPVHHRAVELVNEGAVGELRFMRFSLGWSFQGRRDDYRWQKRHGGGGLLDIGCYCVATSRLIAGADPISVSAQGTFDPETDVDTNMGIMITFSGGATSLIDCGIMSASRNHYEIIGTTGKIALETPFGNANKSRKVTLFDMWGNPKSEEVFTAHQIEVQFELVSKSLLEGRKMPISLDESLANALVLDACMKSARDGGTLVTL